jgi:hypothetical protein
MNLENQLLEKFQVKELQKRFEMVVMVSQNQKSRRKLKLNKNK